jgi:type-IV secretion system protein TraC
MRLRNEEMRRIFDERYCLPDYLPYAGQVEGVFMNVDGSLGMVWEIVPFDCDVASSAALEERANGVMGLLGGLPEDLACQLIFWADRDISPVLDVYARAGVSGESPLVQAVIDEKIRHMLRLRDRESAPADGQVAARRMRMFLAVKMSPRWRFSFQGKGWMQGFLSSTAMEDELAREWKVHQKAFLRKTGRIENRLRSLQLRFSALDAHELGIILYRVLNPERSRVIPKERLWPDFIRDQVLFHAPEARGNGFILDGHHTRVISLKELPPRTWSGMFLGPGSQGEEALKAEMPGDGLYVLNFTVPDQGEALRGIKLQKVFAFLQRGACSGDVSEEAVHKKEELSAVITEAYKTGQPVVYARAHFILYGPSEEGVERACDALLSRLHALGAEGIREEIIAPSLFLSCLPLNYDPALDHYIRRTKKLVCGNFTDMAPFYGAFQGTRTPALLYLNRKGEPVTVDLFDSETNPHAVIIGASGAGKSFLTNDLVYQNYRLGGRFFVIDKGNSYQKTCEALGGAYISFDLIKPVLINPFPKELTTENTAFLIEVLSFMASGGDERDRLTREEKGCLQMAVLETYIRCQGYGEVCLTDLVNTLNTPEVSTGRDGRPGPFPGAGQGPGLALRLAPFVKGGQFGQFFDGPNEFAVNGRFTVFELGGLSAYPDLELVVLLNIMFFITRFVSDAERRGERKFLLIDEAWQLLRMENTAEFISGAFKTFRKYRCSAVAITQEVADLLRQKSGLAILANSANKIFLRQEAVLIERLKNELSLSGEAAAALKGLRTVKGRYSEALVMTDKTSGVVRLVPDPFLYWLATSDARDNDHLNHVKRSRGCDLLAALNECVKEYPYGLRS